MNQKERLHAVFTLRKPDRTPIVGGWLAAPEHIMALTGASEDEYWADPFAVGLQAERVLGSDGVNGIFVPIARGSYRHLDHSTLERRAAYTVESVLAEIDALPTPAEVEAAFDEEARYAELAAQLDAFQAQCGDLLWWRADWSIIPLALHYGHFGYESYFTALALEPERVMKLIRVTAVRARQRAILLARAIRDGRHPMAVHTGEDICTQRGPMVSPEFLRRVYFPLLEYVWEPLHKVGCRMIWHMDGDYRALLDDLIACGIGGFQGFQRECGAVLEELVERRMRNGDPPIIMGPISVTTTLPYGAPDEVRAEVRKAIAVCRDKAPLVLFTSNTINPDVPLANIRAMWETAQEG
jgi:hypothetical protein